MKEYRVTGAQIAAKLDRNKGYVSERVNGKRPLDTEDVDALAMLAGDGWTGKSLLIELARRARAEERASTNVTHVHFGPGANVGGTDETVEPTPEALRAAKLRSKNRGEDYGD